MDGSGGLGGQGGTHFSARMGTRAGVRTSAGAAPEGGVLVPGLRGAAETGPQAPGPSSRAQACPQRAIPREGTQPTGSLRSLRSVTQFVHSDTAENGYNPHLRPPPTYNRVLTVTYVLGPFKTQTATQLGPCFTSAWESRFLPQPLFQECLLSQHASLLMTASKSMAWVCHKTLNISPVTGLSTTSNLFLFFF